MSVYQYEANRIDGRTVKLSDYEGKVLLIVNTASKCAYSRQFAGLQQLYERYREQGFAVLGFPCNQFNGREPGSDPEIRRDCEAGFGITFPLFEKTDVRGEAAHPLFRYLAREAAFRGFDKETENGRWMDGFLRERHPAIYKGDGVKWNFTKFLVDRRGRVAERFEPPVEPAGLEPAILSLLSFRF